MARTTLALERSSIGASGSYRSSPPFPGTKWGDLERRAGEFANARPGEEYAAPPRTVAGHADLARRLGRADDPVVRQDLARLHTLLEIGRYSALRSRAMVRATGTGGPSAHVAKLLMSEITALSAELGLRILGPGGMLTGTDAPDGGAAAAAALFAPAASIYGGTDEIQRNVAGERVLGLPGEPRDDRDVPFRELLARAQRAASS